MALLDTNVLVRFLTADKDMKYQGLYSFFQSLEKGERKAEVKLIVLFQVIFALKSFYKVPREEIAQGILSLLEFKGIKVKEKKIVRRTVELWGEKNRDIVDCYLIASLEGKSEDVLYSYDRDFDKHSLNRKEP